jgi:hypothetical protein
MYMFAEKAGASISSPGFDPIIREDGGSGTGQGTMARSEGETQMVVFACNAVEMEVTDAIYIVGNIPVLGSWTPNTIRMYDDGTHGDMTAHDGVWSLEVSVPLAEEIQYKYTNSGRKGEWVPGEEFSGNNRSYRVAARSASVTVINDTFGKN